MGESIKRIVDPYQDSYSPNGIIGEKDACGVGFVANVEGIESNWILKQSLKGLNCMEHRGGCEEIVTQEMGQEFYVQFHGDI